MNTCRVESQLIARSPHLILHQPPPSVFLCLVTATEAQRYCGQNKELGISEGEDAGVERTQKYLNIDQC